MVPASELLRGPSGLIDAAVAWQLRVSLSAACCGGMLPPRGLLMLHHVPHFHPHRDEVKAAFRRAARVCHPDIDKSPQAAARFTQVKLAADVLLKGVRAAGVCVCLLACLLAGGERIMVL